MKILVIDDVPENLRAATDTLVGHEIVLAGDITDAYNILDSQSFDCVLTDLYLPVAGSIHAQRVVSHGQIVDAKQEAPAGLVFAIKAANKGIPAVIVSDSDHHKDIMCSLLDLLYGNDQRLVIEFQEARSVERGMIGNRIVKDWGQVIQKSRLLRQLKSN